MDTKYKNKQLDQISVAKAIKVMFKDMESGKITYLAFSKKSFYLFIYVLTIGTAANIALIDILTLGTGFIERANTMVAIIQVILSGISIISGIWLFFKGINVAIT
jgi:hypothetical protein